MIYEVGTTEGGLYVVRKCGLVELYDVTTGSQIDYAAGMASMLDVRKWLKARS